MVRLNLPQSTPRIDESKADAQTGPIKISVRSCRSSVSATLLCSVWYLFCFVKDAEMPCLAAVEVAVHYVLYVRSVYPQGKFLLTSTSEFGLILFCF